MQFTAMALMNLVDRNISESDALWVVEHGAKTEKGRTDEYRGTVPNGQIEIIVRVSRNPNSDLIVGVISV